MKSKAAIIKQICPRCGKEVIGIPINSKVCADCLEQLDLNVRLNET